MTKITLPALLRNGYTAVAFYQSHGINIATCNGFDAVAILPENAKIAHQGNKAKLYIDNKLIGCFEPDAYKVRFDSTKAVAAPKKPKPADIVDTAKVEKVARPQKTTIVNVVLSSPASQILQVAPKINAPEPAAKTDALPREKQVRKIVEAPKPKPKEVRKARPKLLKDVEDKILAMMEQRMSQSEMAKRLGVCRCTLIAYIKEKSILLLGETKKLLFNMDSKIQLLMDQQLTRQQIADELGVSKSTLMAYTKEKGIFFKPVTKAPRKRRVLLSKEQWEALLAEHGKSMIKVAKAAKCSKATVQRQLLEYKVPFELWRKQTKIKNSNISLDKHYWAELYKKFNGSFSDIAEHLKCKPSTARTYYYNSGAARMTAHEPRVIGERKKRIYKPKSGRQPRGVNPLKDKAVWERLAQEHKTVKDIAKAVGKSASTCYGYIYQYLPADVWKRFKGSRAGDKDFWLALYEKHEGDWQAIAEETGFSRHTVRTYAQQSGATFEIRQAKQSDAPPIPKNRPETASDRLSQYRQAIIDMMNQGATAASVSRKFGVCHETAAAYLARPQIVSQITYIKPQGAASYELQLSHPKEKIAAAVNKAPNMARLAALLQLDKRAVKSLMIAYDISFKK